MIQRIDKFFIVDFDRCIGSIEANFNILKHVLHELSIVDKQIFASIREKTESEGKTFSAIKYLSTNYPSIDIDTIEKMYVEQALKQSDDLLEPGAKYFLDYLNSTGQNFCIMSYGEKRWQMVKIIGVGIKNTPVIIVSKTKKSNYIRKWFDPKSKTFIVPKNYFLDNQSKEASEIILVDDKITAFIDLPAKAKGYLVLGSSRNKDKLNLHKLPLNVKKVNRIDEIIGQEF